MARAKLCSEVQDVSQHTREPYAAGGVPAEDCGCLNMPSCSPRSSKAHPDPLNHDWGNVSGNLAMAPAPLFQKPHTFRWSVSPDTALKCFGTVEQECPVLV